MQPNPSSELPNSGASVFPATEFRGSPRYRPMVTVDRQTFLDLRNVLRATTKDCLRETFGVSETTWTKLRDGRPVKQITLDRLLVRYRAIVAADEAVRRVRAA